MWYCHFFSGRHSKMYMKENLFYKIRKIILIEVCIRFIYFIMSLGCMSCETKLVMVIEVNYNRFSDSSLVLMVIELQNNVVYVNSL